MKKLALMLMFISSFAGAACIGPFCYDDTGATVSGLRVDGYGLANPVLSSTTINSVSPTVAGQIVLCNSCTWGSSSYATCISTAANSSAWVIESSTTRRCN